MQTTPITIGLIVPPAGGEVPPEGPALYGGHPVRFIARGLALPEVSPDGFDHVVDTILARALALRDEGASAISLMGTSLSFYRGAAFTDDLRERMQAACGVPCTTMSHAIVDSLRALGVQRVAVATSYIDDLNVRLKSYLEARGFEVPVVQGLQLSGVDAMGRVTPDTLMALCRQTWAKAGAGGAQGLLISCGGLHTLPVHVPLEAELGVPVSASSPAGFWDVMRLAGLDAASAGFGALFTPAIAAAAVAARATARAAVRP